MKIVNKTEVYNEDGVLVSWHENGSQGNGLTPAHVFGIESVLSDAELRVLYSSNWAAQAVDALKTAGRSTEAERLDSKRRAAIGL